MHRSVLKALWGFRGVALPTLLRDEPEKKWKLSFLSGLFDSRLQEPSDIAAVEGQAARRRLRRAAEAKERKLPFLFQRSIIKQNPSEPKLDGDAADEKRRQRSKTNSACTETVPVVASKLEAVLRNEGRGSFLADAVVFDFLRRHIRPLLTT